eukprot:350636-Chlamydomonas_euryale.AAC.5
METDHPLSVPPPPFALRAHSPKARSFLADYGAPLMVVVWSAAGYIAADALPGGDPRRITTPNTWEVRSLARSGGLGLRPESSAQWRFGFEARV